jgi:GxxExxY protein
MHENEISDIIIGTAIGIHRKLGPGLLESVYEKILYYELTKKGLSVESQKDVDLVWDGVKVGLGFRADLIVENKVLVELKAVQSIEPVYKKQLLTYLIITGLKLGLLINFNESYLKDGISRIVNQLDT